MLSKAKHLKKILRCAFGSAQNDESGIFYINY